MKSLDQILNELSPERRERVEARVRELIAEETTMSEPKRETCPVCLSEIEQPQAYLTTSMRKCTNPWHGGPVPTPSYAQGQLDQFYRMKKERPMDPIYWDMHEEENRLKDAVKAGTPETPAPARCPRTVEQVLAEHGRDYGNPAAEVCKLFAELMEWQDKHLALMIELDQLREVLSGRALAELEKQK